MKIKVLYFASLREEIGRANDEIVVSGPINVIDAWKQATGLSDLREGLLVAVNQEYTTLDKALVDGDEIAFFPPVTGG